MEKLSKELESALKYANVEIPEHISQNLTLFQIVKYYLKIIHFQKLEQF